ncbi:MAG TPA: MATE family efflux transporter [Steroidobacteraceae bacterium]|nr:MATE family efflux transporter [Steroidobacteraceae bacterium]
MDDTPDTSARTAPGAEAAPTARAWRPAQRHDPGTGRPRIDYRAVAALALPLMLNSSLQAVISLTDTWFVGHISTTAMAGMAAVYWVVLLFVMLIGGVGLAVQTFVAQAQGSGRRARASHAAWIALWASALTVPLYAALAWLGGPIFAPFGLAPEVSAQALAFWEPRMFGAPLGVALWAIAGFFNGISRPAIAVMTTGFVAIVNAVLDWLFIFEFDAGIAGAAWATNLSMACGVLLGLGVFLGSDLRTRYRTHLTWRPDLRNLLRQYRLGLPMGAMYAADLFGMALFQLMQVRLSAVDGAATQIVMMLTSTVYMPGVGIALAGTTLVGQSIGAGDHDWARKLGNAVILLTMGFMGTLGVLLALTGPWLLPTFLSPSDPDGAAVVRLGVVLLWIAAGYQIFDGLNLGAGLSLRGAGDVRVPAVLFLVLSWGVFVPLAHVLSFAPGQGWVGLLPQFGFGALGGWSALLVYVVLLGSALFVRWRGSAWQRVRL